MNQRNGFISNLFPNVMVTHFNVFGASMEDGIFSQLHQIDVVAVEGCREALSFKNEVKASK